MIEYKCKCGASGQKLWRQYQTFLNHIELLCVECAVKTEGKNYIIGEDGRRESEHGGMTDQIGWLVPAVLTAEGDTFWGYTSVPQDRCDWWHALPLRSAENKKGDAPEDTPPVDS